MTTALCTFSFLLFLDPSHTKKGWERLRDQRRRPSDQDHGNTLHHGGGGIFARKWE